MANKDDPKKPELPASLKMLAPYGFYDDDGALKYWHEGHVITDAAQIEMLIERGAPVAAVEAA